MLVKLQRCYKKTTLNLPHSEYVGWLLESCYVCYERKILSGGYGSNIIVVARSEYCQVDENASFPCPNGRNVFLVLRYKYYLSDMGEMVARVSKGMRFGLHGRNVPYVCKTNDI